MKSVQRILEEIELVTESLDAQGDIVHRVWGKWSHGMKLENFNKGDYYQAKANYFNAGAKLAIFPEDVERFYRKANEAAKRVKCYRSLENGK